MIFRVLGILEPVEYTDWATPIVPVIKEDGGIRICGDYKCTVNKALKKDLYQIPAVNDIMTTLKKGKIFAKLDFAQAYQQLPVDEASAKLQTIITHKGAFKPKRLQFGIASAPGIFQKFMDALLGNMDGVIPYFDDVLVVAGSVRELVKVLKEVFERLRRVGIRLKKRKCVFGSDSVTFLGYRIDAQGIHPTAEKVDAIHNAARPRNKPELQAFLGLLNFYHNFLANKAEIVEPLHRLLDKGSSWNWTQEHEKAFQKAKRLISSNSVLIQYDDNLPLTLTCDASPYGIGCVLAHKLPNGKEAPIAFHSRTLAAAERNYAQIDKEALSIIAGIKKFHNYLYGRSFEVKTDHKPLLGLLGKSVQTPAGLSPRMTRWSIMLSAYDYNLVYVPGKQIGNADALSRLPQPGNVAEVPPPLEVLLLESMPDPPLTAKEIAEMTSKDPVLSKVRNWVANGWPSNVNSDELKVFWRRKNELSIHKDCVLRGCCVVVPPQLRRRTLELLHNGHPGIVRMKCLARSYVWWPKVGHEIEALVRSCSQCQESRKDPQKECGGTWPEAKAPWSRVHADFFGPFHGKIFLLVVDAFSKWLEVRIVPSTSSRAAIEVLRELFATHGLPDCIVTDNGTAFKSVEFSRFLKSNHIRHVTSAPFHPASNGQAERSVQTAKEFLQKDSSGDWSVRIARLLLTQHATPSPTTSVSPAELLMNRKLVTCLDRLKPHSHNSFQVDRSPPRKQFEVNDPVFARLYGRTQKWARATITGKLGRVLYIGFVMDFKTQIDKLESASNWSKWKRQIELLLRYHGVLDVVIGKRVAPKTLPVGASAEDVKRHDEEVKCYEKEDTLAQLLLVSSMNEANVELTATSLSAADVWQKLLAVYEQSSGLRMDRLMEELFSCAMKPLEDVVEYVARLQKLFSELNDELEKLANVRLPDLLLMSRILSTLSQEYFELKSVWESVPVSDRSVNLLVERLRLIEMRLPDKTNSGSFYVGARNLASHEGIT
ncbi:hypothetical protein M513_13425 [Trichuris suis]|uniref:RNA-directed DNA polymerase n=1 Tax=Trichuris suis TaxID=68888 RepID=A0A085LL57_9BILA|nr:hypothetical protein M513_13425 [Trichuris suis]